MRTCIRLIAIAVATAPSIASVADSPSAGPLNARQITVPGTSLVVDLWDVGRSDGSVVSNYRVVRDGMPITRDLETLYMLHLRYAEFDPLQAVPSVPARLAGDVDYRVCIVQFVTAPLAEYTAAIERLGGTIWHFLPENALIVRIDLPARGELTRLPFVRWVGPYQPAYRLSEEARAAALHVGPAIAARRYSLQVFERGLGQQAEVAGRIRALGGTVHQLSPGSRRMEATLTGDQLAGIARMDAVAFIEPCSPVEADMDIVREVTGANYIEIWGGYTGAGVRGEALDVGQVVDHCDLQSNPVILHTPGSSGFHAMASLGIAFGDGTCNPQARGMLPDGQPIYADFTLVGDPFQHMAELVDPSGPYQAVFQTRSVGHPRTHYYSTISAELDDVLFQYDMLVTQSMSNAGTPLARPEAWCKNLVSVGGVMHYDTLSLADDCWCGSASIGPAADGRIKPDLVHFYDGIFTLGGCWDCYGEVGGTSASTTIVAGCFGLMFQMWSDGIFGNEVDPGATVFENRPHMTSAKALMINTASQYPFSGPNHDLTRMHQGWGLANVRNPYDLADRFLIVDEERLLLNLGVARYRVVVEPGEPEMKTTMTYADPPGNPAATFARVNDLSLKVTSPGGIVYWGNHGLRDGNYSIPGGQPDKADTVENVFVAQPEPGSWLIEVYADEINCDGEPSTPELDADFALVVSGVTRLDLGDMNCDGELTFDDINPYILALVDPAAYQGMYPDCNHLNADCNCDGKVDFGDINPFVNCITCPGCKCECP